MTPDPSSPRPRGGPQLTGLALDQSPPQDMPIPIGAHFAR
jgi:hypothetical protein